MILLTDLIQSEKITNNEVKTVLLDISDNVTRLTSDSAYWNLSKLVIYCF